MQVTAIMTRGLPGPVTCLDARMDRKEAMLLLGVLSTYLSNFKPAMEASAILTEIHNQLLESICDR